MGCSICLEGFGADDAPAHRPVGLVPCGHIFHHGCVLELLGSGQPGSSRLATPADVSAHRRAVEQRRKHPLYVERTARHRQQHQHHLARNGHQAAGAEPGPSRVRHTDTAGRSGSADSDGDLDDDDLRRFRAAGSSPAYEYIEQPPDPGIVTVSSPVIVCPLCKAVCSLDAMLDLWPSEHDDLDWYKHFLAREGSGPSGSFSKLAMGGIEPAALFNDLAQFKQSLAAFVMHTHSVDIRISEKSSTQVLQMFQRLVNDDYKSEKLRKAMVALGTAAARFASAAEEALEHTDRVRQRESDVAKLQTILNNKDAQLTRASTQLLRDQAEAKKLAECARVDRLKANTQIQLYTDRFKALEAREREAHQREREAKLELSHGLAKRDTECAERIAEADERALAAELAREEAEQHARQARERQQELSEKLRRLLREKEQVREMERERKELLMKVDKLRRKLEKARSTGRSEGEGGTGGESGNLLLGGPGHPLSSSPLLAPADSALLFTRIPLSSSSSLTSGSSSARRLEVSSISLTRELQEADDRDRNRNRHRGPPMESILNRYPPHESRKTARRSGNQADTSNSLDIVKDRDEDEDEDRLVMPGDAQFIRKRLRRT